MMVGSIHGEGTPTNMMASVNREKPNVASSHFSSVEPQGRLMQDLTIAT
jgi:hypothetical protein